MTPIKTPIQMLEHWEATFPDQIYLRQSTGNDWIEYSWQEVADRVRRIATFIEQKAYPKGSTIAIWSTNSADWVIVDLAIMLSGHISVPIYPAQDLETARYILQHSEPKMLFAGHFDQADNVHKILPKGIDSVAILGASIECDTDLARVITETEPKRDFSARSLDDLFSIIYSSGTSGHPKGVMLTFGAISQIEPILTGSYRRKACAQEGDERERIISYLPMSHAAERSLVVIASLYVNSCVSVSAGLEYFAQEILNVRPTLFGAVPRIWYKFMQGVEAALAARGKRIETEEDKAIVRHMLGLDQVKMIVTGSAPIAPAVHDWYTNLGLYLRESYGMTETFAYGTMWDRDEPPQSSCVGRPVTGVELKIDANDEILLKGPVLMTGYYKAPEKTAEAMRDGWYATGDLGRLDDSGNLWITGRVGSVFKTSKGKFINPERLERELLKLPQADQAVVFGHGLAQPVAVINVAESSADKSDDELLSHFTQALDKLNVELQPHERIAALLVTRNTWTIGNELTPTLKLKRKMLEQNFLLKLGEDASGVILDS